MPVDHPNNEQASRLIQPRLLEMQRREIGRHGVTFASFASLCRPSGCALRRLSRGLPPIGILPGWGSRACARGSLLPSAFCLLPSAFCLLPSAFCLLPSAFCLLPSSFFLLPSSFFLLPSAFSLLPSPFCLLPSAFSLLTSSRRACWPTSARQSGPCPSRRTSSHSRSPRLCRSGSRRSGRPRISDRCLP